MDGCSSSELLRASTTNAEAEDVEESESSGTVEGGSDPNTTGGKSAAASYPEDAEGTASSSSRWISLRRSSRGTFMSAVRRWRTPEAFVFPIIEHVYLEAASWGADASMRLPSECYASRRCSVHGGTKCRLWRVRGPVLEWSDHAAQLRTMLIVRAAEGIPPSEVYVRILPSLSEDMYSFQADALRSVRFIVQANMTAAAEWSPAHLGASFRSVVHGDELSDARLKGVLKVAAACVKQAGRQVEGGLPVVVDRRPALEDPIYVAALNALLRRRSVKAIMGYKKKGARRARLEWSKLHGVIGAGALNRVRNIFELHKPGDASRATRPVVAWGQSQIRHFPNKRELLVEHRLAVDSPTRTPHQFWTKTLSGDLCKWDYVVGSASQGVRLYRRADGFVKRLQAHSNRYWDAPQRLRHGYDLPVNENNGFFFEIANVEYEACYSAMETEPVKSEKLMAMSRSFLENKDRTEAVLIIGVDFDVVSILQRALNEGATRGLLASDVGAFIWAVCTFAADGGTIKRKEVTACTACISYEHSRFGRTDLVPIAYVFCGEKRVCKAVGAEVRSVLTKIMITSFTVAVEGTKEAGGIDEDPRSVVPVMLEPEVEVCGTCAASLALSGDDG